MTQRAIMGLGMLGCFSFWLHAENIPSLKNQNFDFFLDFSKTFFKYILLFFIYSLHKSFLYVSLPFRNRFQIPNRMKFTTITTYSASYTEQRTSCGPFRGPHSLVWASRVRSEGCDPHRGPHALLLGFLYRTEDLMWPPQRATFVSMGLSCQKWRMWPHQRATFVSMGPLVSEVENVAPSVGLMW